MSRQEKSSSRLPSKVEQLAAEVASLKARLAALEGGAPDSDGNGGDSRHTRRDWLKLAGAAAAGAAGAVVFRSVPVSAAGNPVNMGPNTSNDPTVTTDIFPSTPASPGPLLQATGQGVSTTTVAPGPIASTTGPASQTVPLIGAIAPGGSLPQVGNPAVADYPAYAPIQGIGGTARVPSGLPPPNDMEDVSEGIYGLGIGANGKGVMGESDKGYGVAGGSGGIDLAAIGNGRIHQLPLPDTELVNGGPAGPPNFSGTINGPNDFEQARDKNGILWLSGAGGLWRRANTVRVDTPDGLAVFAPVRIVDTRSTSPALNWLHPGPLVPNRSYDFGPFPGTYGLPGDAIGILGNLTAIAAVGPPRNNLPTFANQGYLTIYPTGVSQPTVSNVNFGGSVYAWPNFFTVGFGTGANQGMFTIYVFNEAVNVVVDVFAYIQ